MVSAGFDYWGLQTCPVSMWVGPVEREPAGSGWMEALLDGGGA